MNKRTTIWLFFGFWLAVTPAISGLFTAQDKPTFAQGEVLVQFTDDAQDADKAKVLALGVSHSSGFFRSSELSNVYKLKLAAGADVLKTVESLKGSAGIKAAQPNYKYYALGCTAPTDPYYISPENWPLAKIQAQLAWTSFSWPSCPPGSGVVVAVLDTGIDRTNPDLTGVPNIGYNEIGAFSEQDSSCTGCSCYGSPHTDAGSGGVDTKDDFGHGTWVSGIIGAQWGGTGIAGLSAGSTIMPIKVLDCTGTGYSDEITAGIEYATQNNAKVISMSLGGPADTFEQAAVNAAISAGCVVVAASGNGFSNDLSYPAGYPGVLSVGASDQNDNVPAYSQGGTGLDGKVLDLVAPGGADAPNSNFSQSVSFCLFSDFVDPLPTGGSNDGGFLVYPGDAHYGLASGTSGATPYVSASVALVFSLHPTWTNTQVIQQLINNTDSLNGNSGWDVRSGYGRLNIYKALLNSLGTGQVTTYVKTFNSPNPFYPDLGGETNITLVMNQAQSAQLTIYDTSGEIVLNKNYAPSQLNSNPTNPQYKSFYIAWDGKNGANQPVKTGVYFYVVNIGGTVSRNKIVVIRGPQ